MTTNTITDQQRLTTLKHLASGKGLDVVATIVGLPRDTISDIARHHGYPDKDKLAWAADIVEKKIREAATTLPERRPEPTRPAAARPQTPGTAVHPPAAVPGTLTKPDELRVLLNAAKAHPSKRIQAQANRVFDAVDRLRQLLREDEEKHAERRRAEAEKAAARAEIARLEQQLADAKAKLRSKTATAADTTSTGDGPTAAEIRAWANEAGVDCPATGRVPKSVRAAYADAHPMAEAS